MTRYFKNSAIVCIIIISSFSVWLAGNLGAFGNNKIVFDVVSYHSYLPATFIKKDLSLSFYKDSLSTYAEKGQYWANFTKDSVPVIKATYGLSLMYLPFTIWPLLFDNSIYSGYELPFSIAISISNLFYFILSLVILYKLLKLLKYANISIGFALLSICLGTNLLSYASIALGMSHAYNFFLVISLLYVTHLWHTNNGYKYSLWIGVLLGLLILIRPTNILFSLILLVYPMKDTENLKERVLNYWMNYALIAITAFLIVLPQLLYWKYVTGHFLFNSYVDEGFFFTKPHILEYIFGFRKGWLIYSPLIIFAFIGLKFSKFKNPFLRLTLILVPLFIWINSSWWCWWFGGGHGARAMIETYPLLAIGFAAFFEHYFNTLKKVVISLTLFFILFNIKSVDLYRANIIHYDSMTKKAFIYTTFKLFFSKEDKAHLKTLYVKPNYDKALKGEDT